VDPFEYDEVDIPDTTDLRLIARCAGTTYEQIKELNPELKRWVTPPDITSYTLRLPKGTKETFLAGFSAVPPEQKIKWERYEVRRGDTLARVAGQFNSTPDAIREVNGLKKNGIAPGKHLLIPVGINGTPHDVNALVPEGAGKRQMILYRVRRGDTLWKIAKEHNVSVTDIREWNRGIGKIVRAGRKIKLVVDVDQI
jgi:membrane-bound lytic murein transglycosylase D